MWGWIAVIFSVSAAGRARCLKPWRLLRIAIGAVGCIWAGAASDKLQDQAASVRVAQRARVTIIAMAISSVCCVLAALVLHRPMILIPLSLIWGIAVIADSAQFSTIISEVSDKNYVGTALTCQVALGFLPDRLRHPPDGSYCSALRMELGAGQHGSGTVARNLGDDGLLSAATRISWPDLVD